MDSKPAGFGATRKTIIQTDKRPRNNNLRPYIKYHWTRKAFGGFSRPPAFIYSFLRSSMNKTSYRHDSPHTHTPPFVDFRSDLSINNNNRPFPSIRLIEKRLHSRTRYRISSRFCIRPGIFPHRVTPYDRPGRPFVFRMCLRVRIPPKSVRRVRDSRRRTRAGPWVTVAYSDRNFEGRGFQ